MALNLKKDNNEEKTPFNNPEKKSFNLNKSGDSSKSELNLSKDLTSKTSVNNKSLSENRTRDKKKYPYLLIISSLAIITLGIFWFINQNNHSNNQKDDITNLGTEDNTISVVPNSTEIDKESQVENNLDSNNSSSIVKSANVPTIDDNQSASPNIVTESSESQTLINNNTQEIESDASPSQILLNRSTEQNARIVISGVYGNGADRKRALGAQYYKIQAKVNELYKKGLQ